MVIDRRKGSRAAARAAAFYALLLAGALLMLLPVLWMVSASFMARSDIVSSPVNLLPPSLRLQNYQEIFTLFNIGHYLLNSIIVTGTVIVLNVVFCTMTGYSLAKFRYPGRNLVFGFILGTFMIPFTVLAIPLYLLVRSLDWIDSYQGLIAPFALTAFGVFLMRQFIANIPDEYIEAARIDGASEARIFLRIITPLCRPAMATLAILTFVTNWDEFLWPLIVTTTDQHRTITVGLAYFLEQHQNQWHLLMAGAVVAAVPSVILFLVAQRKFLESAGGISGIK
ncbi:MAG: ABC transporter permease subunit [Streptosporangiales bacterium]|nr:ABC transporter permease subunit [Streptosporangiales bacterium]